MKSKPVLLIIFASITFNLIGQKSQIIGHIIKTDTSLDCRYLTIVLKRGYSVISGAIPDTSGYFKINDVQNDHYSMEIQQIGERNFVIDNLEIKNDTIIKISYPPPCKYKYTKNEKIKCIYGHTDHIIPIVYGYPTPRTMRRAKKGIVHLGGCIVSDCDPMYYCTIHKIEL